MDGSLTQEELDALLANMDTEQSNGNDGGEDVLTHDEIDAIGEIANICAGSSATNLSTVLNQRVNITTPEVIVTSKEELAEGIEQPCVVVKINYIEGIYGCNIQILQERDVRIITDLMMGGDGTNLNILGEELTEMHMSALCEAMNQMTGACATSLNTILGKKVDISPPTAALMDLTKQEASDNVFDMLDGGKFITVSFGLEVGDLIDSSLVQIYSLEFAKNLHTLIEENNKEKQEHAKEEVKKAPKPKPEPKKEPVPEAPKKVQAEAPQPASVPVAGMMNQPQNMIGYTMPSIEEVNILPAEFSVFDSNIKPLEQTERIDIIDDVSLEIAVELGKTQKSIREILDFEEGTLVELNRFTGEMMDILVNGKIIAKGEVVVLEDKFAVQLKEIHVDDSQNKRRNSVMS